MSPSDLNQLISDSLLIDAHCHGCDFSDPPSLFDTLDRKRFLFLNSASSPESIRKADDMNRRCPRILNATGIHPWEAGTYGPEDLEPLLPFYRRAFQISEIGMDGVWAPPEAEPEKQEALFRAQLDLACHEGKPVTLHTKGTEDRILEHLNSHLPPSVLIHWFDGDDIQLRGFLDLNCYFSISPAVMNNQRQRDICHRIPADRLLLETDNPSTWPWLFGAPAEPGQIQTVYETVSALLGLPLDDLRQQLRENCRSFLLP